MEQLTRAELEALSVKLESMPRHELETFYEATHNACRYVGEMRSVGVLQLFHASPIAADWTTQVNALQGY